MLFLFTYLALCAAVAFFAAERRNRNPFGWFFLALLISPVIAGIFLAICKPYDKTAPRPDPRIALPTWRRDDGAESMRDRMWRNAADRDSK